MTVRHFLTLDDLTPDEFRALIARAIDLGEMHRSGTVHQPLVGRVLAMIFEKYLDAALVRGRHVPARRQRHLPVTA